MILARRPQTPGPHQHRSPLININSVTAQKRQNGSQTVNSSRVTRYSVVQCEVAESQSENTRKRWGLGRAFRVALTPILSVRLKQEALTAGKVENQLSHSARAGTIDKFLVIAPTIEFSIRVGRRGKRAKPPFTQ